VHRAAVGIRGVVGEARIFDREAAETDPNGTAGGGDAVLLQLKDVEQIVPFMAPEDSPDLKALDVYQLHALVLKKIMAIDTQLPAHQQYITYNVRTRESMENVDSGKFDLVFFMNATPITQVRELAEKGIRLPQKATYFYPKLLSGLVINRFEP